MIVISASIVELQRKSYRENCLIVELFVEIYFLFKNCLIVGLFQIYFLKNYCIVFMVHRKLFTEYKNITLYRKIAISKSQLSYVNITKTSDYSGCQFNISHQEQHHQTRNVRTNQNRSIHTILSTYSKILMLYTVFGHLGWLTTKSTKNNQILKRFITIVVDFNISQIGSNFIKIHWKLPKTNFPVICND